jgi:hypothetical protein
MTVVQLAMAPAFPFLSSDCMQVGSLHGHAGAGRTSAVGLAVQFLSEMCEALRLCLAQLLMCNIKMHQFEVLRQMSSTCIVFLAVGIWALEWPRFVDNAAWLRILQHPHWYLLAGASLLAAQLLCSRAPEHMEQNTRRH